MYTQTQTQTQDTDTQTQTQTQPQTDSVTHLHCVAHLHARTQNNMHIDDKCMASVFLCVCMHACERVCTNAHVYVSAPAHARMHARSRVDHTQLTSLISSLRPLTLLA